MIPEDEFEDDELARIVGILRNPLFWNPPSFPVKGIASILEQVDAEDERAAGLCETLLAAPLAQWRERFRRTPGVRTASMVRQLLGRVPAVVEQRPAEALELTSIAVAIAEALGPQPDWPDDVLMARGQALRDHGYVLSFLGRHPEALAYVERAEHAFAQFDALSFDLAGLALVKASVLRILNRRDEALRLARETAAIYLRIDEQGRYVNARIVEGQVLYDAGAVQEALDLFESLQGNPDLDAARELRILQNVALCLRHLGRHAEADALFERRTLESPAGSHAVKELDVCVENALLALFAPRPSSQTMF